VVFVQGSGKIYVLTSMKNPTPKKRILPRIKYIYIEPKYEAEAKDQEERLSKAYGIVFEAVLKKRKERLNK